MMYYNCCVKLCCVVVCFTMLCPAAPCCAMQAAVKARGWNFCRIDGSVVKAEARQAEVERFQTAPGGTRGIPVFLLTTQVSNLGQREGHLDC
jgi:hypothetical protein